MPALPVVHCGDSSATPPSHIWQLKGMHCSHSKQHGFLKTYSHCMTYTDPLKPCAFLHPPPPSHVYSQFGFWYTSDCKTFADIFCLVIVGISRNNSGHDENTKNENVLTHTLVHVQTVSGVHTVGWYNR